MRDLTINQLKAEHEAGEISLCNLYWYEHALSRFGDKMLNSDARKASDMPESLGGQVFWRSNSPWKEPAGQIVSAKKARRLGGDNYYATQKAIDYEVRVYWEAGMIGHESRLATPKTKLGTKVAFADSWVDTLKGELDSFVIDFAVVGNVASILEMNPPEASGVYGDEVWL